MSRSLFRAGIGAVALISTYLIIYVFFISSSRAIASPSASVGDRAATVAVFHGDTLDDLARLLKPLSFSAGTITFHLRDALYKGSADGQAQLLTVWLPSDSMDETFLLGHSDASKSPAEVADALASGALKGSSLFLVLPVQVSWRDWKLYVSRTDDAALRGSEKTDELVSAISLAPSILAETDTRTIAIPVGYGRTKATAWTPWFESDRVVIRMALAPSSTLPARPDVKPLDGKAGLLVGDDFLNHVFSNEYRDDIWARTLNGEIYRIRDVRVSTVTSLSTAAPECTSTQNQTLLVCANLLDVPSPATVVLSTTFGGDDLKALKVSGDVNCKTLPARDCLKLQGRINVATISLTMSAKAQNQPARPDGVQPLGNFTIGSKPLHGIAQIDRMSATSGGTVLTAIFRFQGGHI